MDNNQQAFPSAGVTTDGSGAGWSENGMTLRDYFAAKAMQAMAGMDWRDWCNSEGDMALSEAEKMAKTAYMLADAMLNAR